MLARKICTKNVQPFQTFYFNKQIKESGWKVLKNLPTPIFFICLYFIWAGGDENLKNYSPWPKRTFIYKHPLPLYQSSLTFWFTDILANGEVIKYHIFNSVVQLNLSITATFKNTKIGYQDQLSGTLKNTKIGFQDQLSLNSGQKYLGAFCNTLDLHEATICHKDLCFVSFWVAA